MFGVRQRGLIDRDGVKIVLIIRRLYCPKCECIHHELPDCIVPYKRHCAETIEEIASSGEKAEVPVKDGRSLQRILAWWIAMLPYFLGILNGLAEKHKTRFGDPPAFKEIIRAVVNTNHWDFAYRVSTRSAGVS